MGSIKIKKITKTLLKLQCEHYNQVETKDSFVINDINEPSIYLELIKKYVEKHNDILLEKTATKNVYKTVSFKRGCHLIKDLITTTKLNVFDNKFKFNKKYYKKTIKKYNISKSPQLKGKVFECQMSKKYNAFLWKDLPITFLNKFGFNRKDIGIDLVDTKNKILYQCKYVKDLYYTDSLKRTFNVYDKIKSIDSDYKLYLIVDVSTNIASIVKNIVKIIYEQFNYNDLYKHKHYFKKLGFEIKEDDDLLGFTLKQNWDNEIVNIRYVNDIEPYPKIPVFIISRDLNKKLAFKGFYKIDGEIFEATMKINRNNNNVLFVYIHCNNSLTTPINAYKYFHNGIIEKNLTEEEKYYLFKMF